jgi:hypothetical protein
LGASSVCDGALWVKEIGEITEINAEGDLELAMSIMREIG